MVDITLPRHWCCFRHTKIVADDETINSVAWPIAMFELVTMDDRVMRRCGGDPATGKLADSSALSLVLGEIGPFCCFLPPDKLAESYELARHPERIMGLSRRKHTPAPGAEEEGNGD